MEQFHVRFPGLGLEFDINRIAFQLGDFKVYWYGLIIMTGLLLAVIYAWRSAERYKVNFNKLFNCILAGLVCGIVGARLYFCLFKWDYYGSHPIEILHINNDLRRNKRRAGRRTACCKAAKDEVFACARHNHDGLFAWSGNRQMGQFYQPRGVWNADRPAVANDKRKHHHRRRERRCTPVLFVRIAVVSARVCDPAFLRKIQTKISRTDFLLLSGVVRL